MRPPKCLFMLYRMNFMGEGGRICFLFGSFFCSPWLNVWFVFLLLLLLGSLEIIFQDFLRAHSVAGDVKLYALYIIPDIYN